MLWVRAISNRKEFVKRYLILGHREFGFELADNFFGQLFFFSLLNMVIFLLTRSTQIIVFMIP